MPKRKRSEGQSLQQKLDKSCEDVFRALKTAKGFERQRLSKRFNEKGVTADKQERLQREITVLKSLDLHQTARAHLYSCLLKIKSIAASTDLPDEIRNGVPKPELSEDEKAALHNVTSGLYSREPVKQSIDRAVAGVCAVLDVPVPEKGKRSRKAKREEQEEQPDDRIEVRKEDGGLEREQGAASGEEENSEEDVTDFEGFQSDVDESSLDGDGAGDDVHFADESAVSKYDHLLGSSSDEDSDEEVDAELLERYRGTEQVNLDDISLSGSGPSSGSESDVESESEYESDDALAPPPPPTKKKASSSSSKPPKAASVGPVRDSTFLPSLMGGYISGSESASDVDVAPAKKRRGQRARQAIAEKKYGEKAKHLHKPQKSGKKGGRDSGWDMRRGAVEGGGGGESTPWKKGVGNPFANSGGGGGASRYQEPQRVETKRAKDNEGTLHPSWEARKKAKQSEKTAAFTGSKVTFD